MRMNTLGLITMALRTAGVLAQDQTPDDNTAQDCLTRLNMLIEQMRMDGDFIPGVQECIFSCNSSKIAYAIGPQPSCPEQLMTIGGVNLRNVPLVINNQIWCITGIIPMINPSNPSITESELNYVINGVPYGFTQSPDWISSNSVTFNGLVLYSQSPDQVGDIANMVVTIQGQPCSIVPDIPVSADVLDIQEAQVLIANTLWKPLPKMSNSEYFGQAQTQVARIPDGYTFMRNFPVSFIRLWAVPIGSYSIRLIYNRGFQVLNTFDPLPLPDGYVSTIVYGLAAKVAPAYGIDATAFEYEFKKACDRVHRLNSDTPVMGCGSMPGRYIIFSDSYARAGA